MPAISWPPQPATAEPIKRLAGELHAALRARRTVVPIMSREPALGIDHHAHRIGAGATPHRQLRIVVQYGVDADDNRIDQRTHAMRSGKPAPKCGSVRAHVRMSQSR